MKRLLLPTYNNVDLDDSVMDEDDSDEEKEEQEPVLREFSFFQIK
jgi:hypothetical protein